MINKKFIELLIDNPQEGGEEINGVFYSYYGMATELKEQIERLEDEFNDLVDSYHNLKQEFLEVKNEKEVLADTCKNYLKEHYNTKKAIEIILKYKINPSTFIFTRKIYKESCGKDLTFEKAYALLEFYGTQEEYNLLKEVLEE